MRVLSSKKPAENSVLGRPEDVIDGFLEKIDIERLKQIVGGAQPGGLFDQLQSLLHKPPLI